MDPNLVLQTALNAILSSRPVPGSPTIIEPNSDVAVLTLLNPSVSIQLFMMTQTFIGIQVKAIHLSPQARHDIWNHFGIDFKVEGFFHCSDLNGKPHIRLETIDLG